MQDKSFRLRNRLMVACALVMAAVLAAPAAMARDHRGRSDHTAEVVGALVVGAVIGGVLASSSHHDRYRDRSYYRPQPYPSNYYYGSYPGYSYHSYPAYAYPGGGYYRGPQYGNSVSIGVVYSNRGHRSSRDYRRSRGYHNRPRGHHNYGRGHGSYYRHGR